MFNRLFNGDIPRREKKKYREKKILVWSIKFCVFLLIFTLGEEWANKGNANNFKELNKKKTFCHTKRKEKNHAATYTHILSKQESMNEKGGFQF